MDYDVRDTKVSNITQITFADPHCVIYNRESEGIAIEDYEGTEIIIRDRTEALNLIKALEKAVDLKWIV